MRLEVYYSVCLFSIKLDLNLVKRKSVQYIQACVFGHGECRTNWENIFDELFNMAVECVVE